jgi:Fe-S-cluster containining protein
MNNALAFDELLKLSKDMESGILDFTIDGHCSNCGSCCGNFLPISAKEIKTIKRYIQKKGIKEQIHRFPTAEAMLDFSCPFHSESEKRCLIYEVRPAICRDFQCDKPRKKIKADKDMYHGRYNVCNMREEFYGKEDSHGNT